MSIHPTKESARGLFCPVGLPDMDPCEPFVCMLWHDWEMKASLWWERGERINGFNQCPKCGLWWPIHEQPSARELNDDGWWCISEWWGSAVCTECHLLMVEQPDGTPECYQL